MTKKVSGKFIVKICLIISLIGIMSINYMCNVFDRQNTQFTDFQLDSESLVMGAILADQNGIADNSYGLGIYQADTNTYTSYVSQIGLQGKIFRGIAKYADANSIFNKLHLLCCGLLALVLTSISIFIYKKYNMIMAGVFYVVFLLSPWIVNFARNLYWVEFTWFLPMLVGLICSFYIEKSNIRRWCYIGAYITVMLKCMCGYEYITTIMMGMISFLTVDFIVNLANRQYKKVWLHGKTIVIIGVMAVLAFLTVICIHANIRGNGNLLLGIKDIIDNDVLRRTLGGDASKFDPILADSLNASIIDVVRKYYQFQTEIIFLIPGKLFLLISILPLLFFVFDKKIINKLDLNEVVLYVVFWATSISWFILGKAHSYIHTHINFVIWYFGYVQICMYSICVHLKKCIEKIRNFTNIEKV